MPRPAQYDDKIIEAVKSFPEEGLTVDQAADLIMRPEKQTGVRMGVLAGRGLLSRKKEGVKFRYFPGSGSPQPSIRHKPRGNGHSCPEDIIASLREQIHELAEWKRRAIERYPDLAVDDLTRQVRRILVKAFEGDPNKQREAREGHLDETPIAKATRLALESAE